jgi:hypothetical protein
MKDQKFPQGIFVKPPHPKAPDFIKYVVHIKVDEAIQGLKKAENEWLNLDLKISKDGKPYLSVNNFKNSETSTAPAEEDDEEDLPF